MAARSQGDGFLAFTGRFEDGSAYDESAFAQAVADAGSFDLRVATIRPEDFPETMRDVAYYLDFPVAGPGSFPQFIVSRMAAEERKVVLGGQGGDEVFGPNYGGATVYTNVRAGYLEECPNVGRLLKNLKFTLAMENEIMGAILDDGQDPEDAAAAWLEAHPDTVAAWLDGVTTFDGNDGLAAVEEHLEM